MRYFYSVQLHRNAHLAYTHKTCNGSRVALQHSLRVSSLGVRGDNELISHRYEYFEPDCMYDSCLEYEYS